MSALWLPLALAETTILLHEILDLKKWHFTINWIIATALAMTTILNGILMIYASRMWEWEYARMAASCDFYVTILHLIMTSFIVMPLLGHHRLLWLLKVRFLVSIPTLDIL
jgi:phosphatidylserine synthase